MYRLLPAGYVLWAHYIPVHSPEYSCGVRRGTPANSSISCKNAMADINP